MPATSQQQQKLFGLALSVKRGETPRSEVSDDVLNIVDTMSEKDIKDFAETSHSGLPKKVESIIRGFVRETLREKVLSEAPTRRSKDFFEDSKSGIELHKLMRGKWDRDKALQYFIKLQSDKKDSSNIKNPNEKYQNILYFIATGLGINGRSYKSIVDLRDDIITAAENLYKIHNESVNEEQEQLDEKLITFSNRAPYGQVVFIAGGAGSGKGFAIENFIDSAGYKVRDVDEMKKQIQRLNAIGKLSIQQIIDNYGRNIAPKDMDIIKKIQNDGYDLKSMNLKNPNHVYALHILVDSMGIKDKTLENMLAAKSNPETLPNIIFDITAKKITSITEVLPMLHSVGYKPNNIHLVWILTDYEIAIKQNAERARVVPADIMLDTHIGAGNTVWGMVTSALPKGMNGRVDVILNNQQNTVFFIQRTTDKKTGKKKAVVSGFLSLPVKKQGGPILPEKLWKDTLYNWIKDNGPKELTANF
jgi:dephospho-CoA kinase